MTLTVLFIACTQLIIIISAPYRSGGAFRGDGAVLVVGVVVAATYYHCSFVIRGTKRENVLVTFSDHLMVLVRRSRPSVFTYLDCLSGCWKSPGITVTIVLYDVNR